MTPIRTLIKHCKSKIEELIIIIIIIIIYSIYRALIFNGPKVLYIIKITKSYTYKTTLSFYKNSQWSKSALHNKNKNKILNLQNYKTTLSSYKNIIILYNIITNFKKPRLELRFKRRKGITRSKFESGDKSSCHHMILSAFNSAGGLLISYVMLDWVKRHKSCFSSCQIFNLCLPYTD